MKWPLMRISEVFFLKQGKYLEKDEMAESRSDEFPFAVYGANGVVGYSKLMMYSERVPLISCRGANCGVVHLTEPKSWVGNNSIACVPRAGDDSIFFFYQFSKTLFTDTITGAAQPQITLTNLSPKRVCVPPVETQKAIADILSGYDDLIENNRRRMVLLEESARLLYREWFVRLRFPGHESTRIVNGVPVGWRKVVLGDICTDSREMVSPESLEPDTPYIGLEHMPRRSISLSDWGTAEQVTSSKLRFSKGDILFGKIRPYFHKVGIAITDGVVSSDSFVIRPTTDVLKSFVLLTVSSDEFIADTSQSMKEGAKMPRADWKQMIQFPVMIPPSGLLENFSETIEAITDQLSNLCFQNQKLSTARDLLLPKLMSGEIEV